MSSTTVQNRAAYIDEVGAPLRVGDIEMPVPEADEVLIKVHAVAINPVECIRQSLGFGNPSYPWVFGTDTAGVIESVGSSVTKFKAGDRVAAMSIEYFTQKRTDASFQHYMKTSTNFTCKIPDSMSFTDAAVIPLGLSTAAGMAFETVTLNLRFPMSSSELQNFSTPSQPEVVTVWGGSSSVGATAIQMIHAAGYRVIGLASQRNWSMMKECGADECFDYSDDKLVEKLSSFVKEKGWVSAGILVAAGVLPPGPVAEETRKRTGEIALALGGKKFVSTPLARGAMDLLEFPEGVQTSNVFAISEEPLRDHIWGKWMEGAFESGLLKALPPADVVSEGLEGLNHALAVASKGVSGKKIVVKIC